MHLDVRIPIGLMFVIFGVLLALFGLVSGPQPANRELFGQSINLTWGVVQIVFGAFMLWLAARAKKKGKTF